MPKTIENIFLVVLNWSTDDDEGLEIYPFAKFNDAYNKFQRLIEDEHNPDVSWIGEGVFDENGDVTEGYEFDCLDDNSGKRNCYWHLVDENNYYRHTFIDLMIREVL